MSLTTSEMTPADIAAVTGGNGYGNGMNGDGWWIILFLILAMGGNWGNGFGNNGGNGGWNGAIPWFMNNDSDVERGFDQMATTNALSGIQSSISNGFANTATQICGGFGDVQQTLCNGFAGVNQTVNSGFANAETAANARQMANMQTAFSGQTAMTQGFNSIASQLADCCCENRLGISDLKYTVATENCADRYEAAQNTRDIIEAGNRNSQAILDKLCALELDGVKAQLAQAERENVGLQNQLNMATMQNGMNSEVDALYNRLKNCPVPTMPVYGNTPIFTCGGNNGCGCGSF